MNKKIYILITMLIFTIMSFSAELFISPSYSLTHQATSQAINELTQGNYEYDYLGGRVSYLIDTEDTGEIKYGPYIGIFYIEKLKNSPLNAYNDDIKSTGLSLGLNVKYNSPLFKDLNFSVNAYGGVNSPDYLKTFSTEILVQAGLSYSNIYLLAGYETRYYKLVNHDEDDTYLKVNHFPFSMGVALQF
ncbi:MAG: hypothetical protein ACQESN_00750 [Thermotogota bacterium]